MSEKHGTGGEIAPRSVKLTTQAADRLRFADWALPDADQVILWDDKLAGFGLRIMRSGVRSWVVQYRTLAGRQRRLTIGKLGKVTAAEARELAQRIFTRVLDGGDPLAERQAQREAPTVNELLDRYVAEHVKKKTGARTQAEVIRLLELFVRPALGRHKIQAVTRSDMAKLHGGMSTTPRQANMTLAYVSKVFNLAERWGLRPDGSNPCRTFQGDPARTFPRRRGARPAGRHAAPGRDRRPAMAGAKQIDFEVGTKAGEPTHALRPRHRRRRRDVAVHGLPTFRGRQSSVG
jgi:hypothetical protein